MYKWLCLIFVTTTSLASPLSNLHKVGQGDMNYLFWTVYHAEYYEKSTGDNVGSVGTFVSGAPESNTHDKALKIEYFRSINKEDLIGATIDQWQHLGYSEPEIRQWSDSLESMWPNVESGDVFIFFVGSSGLGEFYFNDNFVGKMASNTSTEAFLSIWFSEQTSQPNLRQQLLGNDP